jgi:hypothetical protein
LVWRCVATIRRIFLNKGDYLQGFNVMSHSEYDYTKTLQNTLIENHIRRMAHNIIELNKSRPDVVEENIKIIRQKIAVGQSNSFKVTIDKSKKLAELAAYAARLTSHKVSA